MVGLPDVQPVELPLKVFKALTDLSNLTNPSESEQEQLVTVRRQLLLLRALHQVIIILVNTVIVYAFYFQYLMLL